MSNECHNFRDRIADLVTGAMPESDRRELDKHLTSCADCRGYLQDLRQEDVMLTEHFAGLDKNMVDRQERALQRIRCSHTNQKRKRISIWREIMRSPFSKLATAATVVLVAAVSIVVLDRSAAPAYGLAGLSAAFEQASVIHVEGWQYFPRIRVENGTSRPPVPIRTWIDLNNGRIQQMQVAVAQSMHMSAFNPPDVNTTVTVTETICDGSYLMTLDHNAKTATFTRISDYGRQLMAYRQARMLWGQLCGQPEQLENFVKTGREEIDGNPYDIWQLDGAGGMGGLVFGGGGGAGGGSSSGSGQVQGHIDMEGMIPTLQSRLWLAADSGRLGRAQVLSRIGDGRWQLEQDYHTIDYDVKIPAGTFATELPAGYTATNSKETAPLMELPRSTVRGGNLECSVLANFTLSDGSVIVAWQSRDCDAEEAQEPLFVKLIFGGPLPKLPLEIYSLKPAGGSERSAYAACHLGQTTKAGRFIEWALYVPKTVLPANSKYLSCDALFRFNVATPPSGGMGMTVSAGVPVRTAEEFDKWVRGAMAELSDNATAPADVTYPRVSNLAQQTHTPVKP